MHRFKAFRRVVRQKMAIAIAPLALAGIVIGGGALTASPAQAYSASTGCASTSANPGKGLAFAHQSCVVQVAKPRPRTRAISIRWAKVAPPVVRRVATPTPTPVPPGPVNPPGGNSSVAALIMQIFGGSYGPGAINVARCESGLNPNAYNPTSIGGSHAAGVFQILYPSTWDTTPEAGSSPYNAAANIEAAHAIFVRDGYNWHEWSCQP